MDLVSLLRVTNTIIHQVQVGQLDRLCKFILMLGGPTPKFDSHDFLYYIMFINDYTRMNLIYFLKQKPKFFDVFVSLYK